MSLLNLCCTDQVFLTKEEPSKVRCAKLLHFYHSTERPDSYDAMCSVDYVFCASAGDFPKTSSVVNHLTMSLFFYES